MVLPASSIGASRSWTVTSIFRNAARSAGGGHRAVARDDPRLRAGELEDAIGRGDHAADPSKARRVDVGIEAVGEEVAGVDHVVRREMNDQVAVGVRGRDGGQVQDFGADVELELVGREGRQGDRAARPASSS